MGRLVLGRPGPVTYKEERGKRREKREKEERKKERKKEEEKKRKKREEREEDLRPIWASSSRCTLAKATDQHHERVLAAARLVSGLRPSW